MSPAAQNNGSSYFPYYNYSSDGYQTMNGMLLIIYSPNFVDPAVSNQLNVSVGVFIIILYRGKFEIKLNLWATWAFDCLFCRFMSVNVFRFENY